MFERYWDRHPIQYAVIRIIRDGQWVTHLFEWLFMMISRFAGYAMTLAIGYLIYYAIEFKQSLDTVMVHPGLVDTLASLSNVVINVGPELVFPGVVVLCMQAFTVRRWLDGLLYLGTALWCVILTMVLLHAFMSNQITASFLSVMLFWRAGAALFYTVVAAYASGHGGLDIRVLLQELDTLRGQLDTERQSVSCLREQVSRLQAHLDRAQQEVSRLQAHLESERNQARHHLDPTRRDLSSCQQERTSSRASVQVSGRQGNVLHLDTPGQGRTLDTPGQGNMLHLDTSRPRKTSQDERTLGPRIRALLQEEPHLSGRAIAARLGCSPTTAARWKSQIEGEQVVNA